MIAVPELWGRPEERVRHWSVFVGGFAGVVAILLFVVVLGSGSGSRLAYNLLLPVALFYAPPAVSAVSAYRGGGLLVSLVIGLIPALSFGLVVSVRRLVGGVWSGDLALWELVLAFGVLGVVGSVVGFLAGRASWKFVEG